MSEIRQESKLFRNVGFWPLMGIAVGQIIGAGIMSNTGIAIGMTGTGVALAFLISPILTLISITPDAILGATLPVTGGKYRYTSRMLGKKAGFVYLALYCFSNLTLSLYALSFASYLVSIVGGVSAQLVAMVMLTVLYLLNLIGTKSAAIVNTLMCVLMIGGILLFIGFGAQQVDLGYVFNKDNLFTNGAFGFASTLALLSFATGGAQVIAEMGGEIKEPGKNIPKVMIVSTLSVGILYVFMACVAADVLPMEVTANQPLTAVAREAMPFWAFYLFVIFAALGATATTLNAQLSWVTKPILVACEDGILPKSLASVSSKGAPYKILTLFYIIDMLPLMAGLDLAFVSKTSTAISLALKVLLSFAFLKLPSCYPQQLAASPLRVSNGAVKVIGVVCIILNIVLSGSLILNLPGYAIIGFAVLVIASIVYANVGLKKAEIPDDLTVDYSAK